jgi:hypothetical protein
LPEEDVEYFGSFSDKTFKPTRKIILRSDYENAEELAKDEVILHDFYGVAINPHFANKAKATSTSFDRTGAVCSSEHKRKVSAARAGKLASEEAKQKMKVARTGKKHSDRTKQKIREALTGKTFTEERKQSISEANTGKNWYVNATGETHQIEECPGPEWQPGRKWKNQPTLKESDND